MSEVKEIELLGDTPDCQLDCDNPAEYDMPTIHGPWAYICEKHYQSHTPPGAGAIGTRITWVVEVTEGVERGQELLNRDFLPGCGGATDE